MSDHNKCPYSEKEHEKCIFRFSFFHRIQPRHWGPLKTLPRPALFPELDKFHIFQSEHQASTNYQDI